MAAEFSRNEFIFSQNGKNLAFTFKTGGAYNRTQSFMAGVKGQVGFEGKYEPTTIEGTINNTQAILDIYFEMFMDMYNNGTRGTGIHRAVLDGTPKSVRESPFGNVIISKEPMFTDADEGQLRELSISFSVNDYLDPVNKTE